MKDRIQEFLIKENKTSAQLAADINVQASGISHILSGRNNPSLDFILKMLEKYPYISMEWLLFGKGSMYREQKIGDLFGGLDLAPGKDPVENEPVQQEPVQNKALQNEAVQNKAAETPDKLPEIKRDANLISKAVRERSVIRIVWFFEDNSFEEFFPSKH
ncbi:MAG: helix-turn-helix domain-containing protein [Bacteroidales bacterium]|jgi:transcriptional regulator with XRE-family HTH domain